MQEPTNSKETPETPGAPLDHDSHKEFYDYYARQSESEDTRRRFLGIRDTVLRVLRSGVVPHSSGRMRVADIGCGAGTQCMIWARLEHEIHGLDINQPLVKLADERAQSAGLAIDYRVGSATALPWGDQSMDICLVPELLEHVPDWRRCLDEFARILAPNGVLFISTNNKLCPVQYEFNLPCYSWYPGWIKRRCERLAVTTRPDLANYAKYPAVNWFTYYALAKELKSRGLKALDRFDVMEVEGASIIRLTAVALICNFPPLRWLAHLLTPYTVVLAVKKI